MFAFHKIRLNKKCWQEHLETYQVTARLVRKPSWGRHVAKGTVAVLQQAGCSNTAPSKLNVATWRNHPSTQSPLLVMMKAYMWFATYQVTVRLVCKPNWRRHVAKGTAVLQQPLATRPSKQNVATWRNRSSTQSPVLVMRAFHVVCNLSGHCPAGLGVGCHVAKGD